MKVNLEGNLYNCFFRGSSGFFFYLIIYVVKKKNKYVMFMKKIYLKFFSNESY